MTRTLLAVPALVLALAACGNDRDRPAAEPTAPARAVEAAPAAAAVGSSNASSVCRGLKRERAQLVRVAASSQTSPSADEATVAKAQEQVEALNALIADACL